MRRSKGYSYFKISKEVGVNMRTAFRIIKKWNENGTIERSFSKGRPEKLTRGQINRIWVYIEEKPETTSREIISSLNLPICCHTLSKVLKRKLKMKKYTMIEKPHLYRVHKDQRMNFVGIIKTGQKKSELVLYFVMKFLFT